MGLLDLPLHLPAAVPAVASCEQSTVGFGPGFATITCNVALVIHLVCSPDVVEYVL